MIKLIRSGRDRHARQHAARQIGVATDLHVGRVARHAATAEPEERLPLHAQPYGRIGTVVVEQTFALPGLGAEMVTAAAQRDFPVVQGLTLVFGLGIILFNLASDLVVSVLDPRTRWT